LIRRHDGDSAEHRLPGESPACLAPGLLIVSVQAEYEINDPAGLELLRQAAEAADRIASCRRQIDEQGELLVIKGVPRVNPLCAVERDQRAALVRCLRHMNLDIEPLRDRVGRPSGGVGITCDQLRKG
jgi:hypothetical protein